MIIGVNHRTAPVAVRERFWMTEEQQRKALAELAHAEGVQEIIVVSTCNRTEFVLWTQDASMASGSVLNFLTRDYGLKLCEWKHFYRKLDVIALDHVFRVAAGLDSMTLGEREIVERLKAARTIAQEAGTLGQYLDAVTLKALTVAPRVRSEVGMATSPQPVFCVAAGLANRIFGSLNERNVLLVGCGDMIGATASCLVHNGANRIRVLGRNAENVEQFATAIGATPVFWDARLEQLTWADVIISATSSPELVYTREEIACAVSVRDGAPLLLVDMALPRDIDGDSRQIEGVFLYDLDQLAEAALGEGGRSPEVESAERLAAAEAKEFNIKLLAQRIAPTIAALRQRLSDMCMQELESFYASLTSLSVEQQELVEAFAARLIQRIGLTLAQELKEPSESVEQERLTAAVQRLFHLEAAAVRN